jgi:glycosyltransferase involved in cell wall biosynthesis
MKKVLVRVPAYNHEKFVERCLESIAAQDYPSVDVVVVDDSSTDGTSAIAAAACRRLGFRFHQNERNLGLPATLNKMVSLSGPFDFVFSIASDDILFPGALSAMVAAMEDDAGTVGAYGDVIYLNAEGVELGFMRNDKLSGDLYEGVIFGEIAIPRPWIMWSAAAYSKFGAYDEGMPLEDSYAFAKMGKLGHIRYCGAPILGYRKHANNTSANAWLIYSASCRMLQMFRDEPFYPKLRRLYGSENFHLLSRSHKLEALRHLPDALTRPFRRQFWAAILNILGLGFIVDSVVRR